MNNVDVIWDLDIYSQFEPSEKRGKRTIKDKVGRSYTFDNADIDQALAKGLLKKTDDGFVFVGRKKDLHQFKKKRP